MIKPLVQIFALYIFLCSYSLVSATSSYREATYYADAFEGKYTANGEIFSQSGFTAAVCDIPLGSNILVRNTLGTGAIVRVNDRPNCTRYPKILDLTKTVFSLFSPLSAGRINTLSVDTLDLLDTDIFSNLHILLETTPMYYRAGEHALFRGRVTDKNTYALFFLQNKSTKEEITKLVKVSPTGEFSFSTILPDVPGEYSLVITSGNSFRTQKAATINLIDGKKVRMSINSVLQGFFSPKLDTTSSSPTFSFGKNTYGEISLQQDTKVFSLVGTNFSLEKISPLLKNGKLDITGTLVPIGTGGSFDLSQSVIYSISGTVILDRTHEKIGEKLVSIRPYKSYTTMKFRVPSAPRIKPIYYLTLPNGDVREFDFPKGFIDNANFLIPGKSLTVSLPTTETGTYLIETVKEDGIAYFNLPIVRGQVWNLLRPISDESLKTFRNDGEMIRLTSISRINKLRASLGRNLLISDETLNRLADAKMRDMIERKYVGHVNPDGEGIASYAERLGIDFGSSIGENIASGNISDLGLQDGLEESGSHRYNMLRPDWTKIGVSYYSDGKNTYIVQLFGK